MENDTSDGPWFNADFRSGEDFCQVTLFFRGRVVTQANRRSSEIRVGVAVETQNQVPDWICCCDVFITKKRTKRTHFKSDARHPQCCSPSLVCF